VRPCGRSSRPHGCWDASTRGGRGARKKEGETVGVRPCEREVFTPR
jgi:hypothetical protein